MNTNLNPLDSDPALKVEVHQVPAGYFDQLPGAVQRRVSTRLQRRPWTQLAYRVVAPALGVVLVVGFGLTLLFTGPKKGGPADLLKDPRKMKELMADADVLTRDEVLLYLNENIDRVDERLLTERYNEVVAGSEPRLVDSLIQP